jgi:ABC-2 type transport system permease protein
MLARVLKVFWTASLSSEMEYRANFVTSAMYSLGQLVGTVFTIRVIYGKGYQFPGWSLDQTYLVVAMFTLLDGITTSALSPNLSKIVQHVQRGSLDFILLKPLDSQLQLSTRNLTPWGFPNILFAIILLGVAGRRLGFGAMAYVAGILPIVFAVIILYSLWFAVGTTTIWFTKVWNATEVLRSVIEAAKYPVAAYQPGVRLFFTFVMPIAFLTTVPAEVMRGSRGVGFIAIEAALAAALFLASRMFWRIALRHYTSASS